MKPSEKFIHFSAQPLTAIRSRGQLYTQTHNQKPVGLWFSVGDGEDGWRAWCEREDWGLSSLKYQTELVFHNSAKILRLRSAGEIDTFTRDYGHNIGQIGFVGIDWYAVAAEYDALIIAPYCWSRRLELKTSWYYGWDCASGCVWNAEAVAELRPLTNRVCLV